MSVVNSAEVVALPRVQRYPYLKRLLLLATGVIALLCVLRAWWGYEATRRFQTAIDAYRAAGEPILLEDFQFPPVPRERNAAAALEDAIELLSKDAHDDNLLYEVVDDQILLARLIELRELLACHRDALELARAARDLPDCRWSVEVRSPAIEIRLPQVSTLRFLARLQVAGARAAHLDRDDEAAIELIRDAFEIARRLRAMRMTLMPDVVACAIDSQVGQAVQQLLPTLAIETSSAAPGTRPASRAQLQTLIAYLCDERSVHESFQWALRGERMCQLDAIRLITTGRLGFAEIMGLNLSPAQRSTFAAQAWLLRPAYMLDGVRMAANSTAQIIAAESSNHPAAIARLPANQPWPSAVTGIASRMASQVLQPSLTGMVGHHYRMLGIRRRAALELAARLFELDHGDLPVSPDELVPDYLDAAPLDPSSAIDAKLPLYAPPTTSRAR